VFDITGRWLYREKIILLFQSFPVCLFVLWLFRGSLLGLFRDFCRCLCRVAFIGNSGRYLGIFYVRGFGLDLVSG